MKPAARPLDTLLYTLLLLEVSTCLASVFSPIELVGGAADSSDPTGWRGFWYLLFLVWWIVAVTLSFWNHRRASYYYRWSWGAAFILSALIPPYSAYGTAFGETMGQMNTFLGGACCLLLWMRFRGIGEWSQESLAALIKRRWFGWSPPAVEQSEVAAEKAGTEV